MSRREKLQARLRADEAELRTLFDRTNEHHLGPIRLAQKLLKQLGET